MNYEIEVVTFEPRLTSNQFETPDPGRAAAYITSVLQRDGCTIIVAAIEAEVDYGDFLLWLCADRALVRLDEHREHYARDPAPEAAGRVVTFRNEDGSPFTTALAETVPRQLGIDALLFWLSCRGKLETLNWE